MWKKELRLSLTILSDQLPNSDEDWEEIVGVGVTRRSVWDILLKGNVNSPLDMNLQGNERIQTTDINSIYNDYITFKCI